MITQLFCDAWRAWCCRAGRPQPTGPLDVSFVPDAPKTYAQFAALVGGRPAGDLPLIVARIRGANAAVLAAHNRRGLQVGLMDLQTKYASCVAC